MFTIFRINIVMKSWITCMKRQMKASHRMESFTFQLAPSNSLNEIFFIGHVVGARMFQRCIPAAQPLVRDDFLPHLLQALENILRCRIKI